MMDRSSIGVRIERARALVVLAAVLAALCATHVGAEEERREGVPGDRAERREGVPGDREERREGAPGDRAEREVRGRVLTGGRPTANAVVWFESPDMPASRDTQKVVLDQRNLRFSPQVLAVQVGTSVLFPNNDRVFHNVFSFHHGKVFDLGLYPAGDSKVVRFDKPGLSRIFCNIHPNMAAYVFAVDSPYFAVSDNSGAFVVSAVPTGRYTYHAWRAGAAAELSGQWSVDAESGALSIEWRK